MPYATMRPIPMPPTTFQTNSRLASVIENAPVMTAATANL